MRAITEMTEQELTVWHDRATESYARDSDPCDRACVFRARGLSLFENYMRLVMYSFGFEEAWKKRGENALEPGDMFFVKCLQCATGVVKQLCEYAGDPGEYLKYAPDCYFVMGGFSGAFLLKVRGGEDPDSRFLADGPTPRCCVRNFRCLLIRRFANELFPRYSASSTCWLRTRLP